MLFFVALPQALELDQSVELKDKSLVDKITADGTYTFEIEKGINLKINLLFK